MALARTTSGTMQIIDTPKALTFSATVDPRQSLANDLAITISRGDVTQMSIGFMVGRDVVEERLRRKGHCDIRGFE
jgi:phage head maturation protease